VFRLWIFRNQTINDDAQSRRGIVHRQNPATQSARNYCGLQVCTRQKRKWPASGATLTGRSCRLILSGRRDLNPRRSPWQG
jgi:hypothetical protein